MKAVVTSLLALSFLAAPAVGVAASDPTSGKKITANVASVYPPGSPLDKGLDKLKEILATKTNGRIAIQIHRGGAMGDEKQTFETLSQGSVELGAVGSGDISTYFPKYFISEVPYIFSGQEDFWKFWNGPGKELSAIIEQQRGVRTEGIIFRGARYLTSNRPVKSVEEVEGLKMRLPPIKAWFQVWESLGAIPQTIAFSEVYMSLKTGVVEAQENPPETILAYKMYEAQKYLIATEHVYGAARILSSSAWWDTLSKDDQALFSDALKQATEYANSITRDGDAEMVKKLQEIGMTLITVDKEAFKKAAQPVVDSMAESQWDPDFYQKVKDALK